MNEFDVKDIDKIVEFYEDTPIEDELIDLKIQLEDLDYQYHHDDITDSMLRNEIQEEMEYIIAEYEKTVNDGW